MKNRQKHIRITKNVYYIINFSLNKTLREIPNITSILTKFGRDKMAKFIAKPEMNVSGEDDAVYTMVIRGTKCYVGTSTGGIHVIDLVSGKVIATVQNAGPDVLSLILVGKWLVYSNLAQQIVAKHLTTGETRILATLKRCAGMKFTGNTTFIVYEESSMNPTTWHLCQTADEDCFEMDAAPFPADTAIFTAICNELHRDFHPGCVANCTYTISRGIAVVHCAHVLFGVDMATKKCVWRRQRPHVPSITSADDKEIICGHQLYCICNTTEDSRYAATGFRNGVVKFWDVTNGNLVSETRFDCELWSMCITGNCILVGDANGNIHRKKFVFPDAILAIQGGFDKFELPLEISAMIFMYMGINIFNPALV
jgi:hypothetical protein